MAALLDHLGIARAGVYTWSGGGGPAGYRLAVRHPDRVTAVVANAACSQAYHLPDQEVATRLMFNTAPGQCLLRVLAAHGGKQYIQGVVADEGDLTPDQIAERVDEIFADPAKRQFVTDLGPTALPDGRRRTAQPRHRHPPRPLHPPRRRRSSDPCRRVPPFHPPTVHVSGHSVWTRPPSMTTSAAGDVAAACRRRGERRGRRPPRGG